MTDTQNKWQNAITPPLRLHDFLAFVHQDSNLKPHAKDMIMQEAEKFRQAKERTR